MISASFCFFGERNRGPPAGTFAAQLFSRMSPTKSIMLLPATGVGRADADVCEPRRIWSHDASAIRIGRTLRPTPFYAMLQHTSPDETSSLFRSRVGHNLHCRRQRTERTDATDFTLKEEK